MRHEKLNKAELAERFGVDVRSITNWVALGMPQRKESGRLVFSWPECREWREDQIRNDARAIRHADNDADKKTKAAEYRLRQLEIETEQAELDLAERRGELVPVDFMTSEFSRIAQALRNQLLSLPSTWAMRLGTAVTTIDRQIILQDAINDLMPQLQELADADDDEPGRDAGAEQLGEPEQPAADEATA